MKVFIAVPTFENIYPETFKSIYGLNRAGHYVVFDFIRGYDCEKARNRIAQQAMDENADYVLTVDSDIVLPSDALVNMLEDPKEVCLGVYASRACNNQYDGNVCLYKMGEFDYKTKYTTNEIISLRNSGTYKLEVHGGGMGCALIRTDVFQRVKNPWFKWVNYDNGTVLSEDLYFCSRCKNANIPIYTDTRVLCGHVFRHTQWPI